MKEVRNKAALKVSVLLLTYNHERYIAQAIDSVLAQKTSFPYEIVLGEDCSTDATPVIVKRYAKEHPDKIRLFLQPRNRNQLYRKLLPKCRGEYVALLEGDDYWSSEDKLQLQVAYLDKHRDCSLCFHSVRVVCEEGVRSLLPPIFPPENFPSRSSTKDLIDRNFIHTASVVFRRDLMPTTPPWMNSLPLGDWPSWVCLSFNGYLGYVPGVMATYRVHAGGMWSSQRERALRGTIAMFEQFESRLPKKYLPAVRQSLARFREELTVYLKSAGTKADTPLPREVQEHPRTHLQIFAPKDGKYHEEYSRAREFTIGRWQRLQVDLPESAGDNSAPLRLDPGNKPGIVDIAGVLVRSSVTGEVLWRAKKGSDFASATTGGTAIRLSHPRLLRVLNFGEDPQIYLPVPRKLPSAHPIAIEAWLRLDNSSAFIAEAVAGALRELATGLAELEQRYADLQRLLKIEETRHVATTERLTMRDNEARELRQALGGKEEEKTRLLHTIASLEQNLRLLEKSVTLLERLKRERGEFLRERGQQTRKLSRLEQELASQQRQLATKSKEIVSLQAHANAMAVELEKSRRATWKERVRRADATARLMQREEELRSLPWKAVKPLWKLGRALAPKREPAVPGIAFVIDSPADWDNIPEKVSISGWCFCHTGEKLAGVRARIGRKTYIGRYGLERNDVAGEFGYYSAVARHSGFVIECSIPAEPSTVILEAIVQGDQWKAFLQREVRQPAPGNQSVVVAKVAVPSPPDETAEFDAAKNRLVALFEEFAEPGNAQTPRFSIVTPTYNTNAHWLVDAAESLVSQTLKNWEWCIVDDGSTNPHTLRLLKTLADLHPRLHIKLGKNAGISSATNQAMSMARGEFVCFMDHDDWLAPEALAVVSQKIDEGFDVVYSDEDKYEEKAARMSEPFHKPDWSPEYLRGVMYVGHLLTVRRTLAQQVGFDKGFDGVQDFEFMLRVGETDAAIGHIPKVLYHWRKVPGSIASEPGAKSGIDLLQKKAVDAHLARLGLPAQAEIQGNHRLRMVPRRKTDPPTIGIIIPTKDAPKLIGRCLESLYRLTSYSRYEVVVMDNETTDAAALEVMDNYPIKRVKWTGDFNFSAVNNIGSEHTSGSYLVFLNNDTEIVTEDWLQHLLYYAEQPDVGAAGPLLLYPNRTVQHAGVALGMRGTADHVMRGFPAEIEGYAGSLSCAREVSAVTAACMMMSRERFKEVGRFSTLFATLYQDVDLCLRLRERQLRIIYTPRAVLIHHESASRKSYYDMVDRMFLLDQWETLIEKGDPYYNRNLDLDRGDYSMATRG